MKICISNTEKDFSAAAELLSAMANARRLEILCTLDEGEITVGRLAERIGLSQSALSQHLAKLRKRNLVQCRRNAQQLFYSLHSDEVREILKTLRGFYDQPIKEARAANA